ncbi:MAG: galactosyldiacylglycerol synthase [Gammaproteobacteria bacterium]|nr:galactosyldiacylglycerol synthase [Gammaproteobacteria bacterium]
MVTIDLVYFNAGGGHLAAARALEETIRRQRRPWNVRLVNLFEILDPNGVFERLTGMKPEGYYNARLASGWTIGLGRELRVLQALIRLWQGALVARLSSHWRATRPDLVVSLVPNFNRVMHDALAQARPGVAYATVLTDLADFPPHFWIEPGTSQHLICGTARALEQARAAGCDPRHLHATSGMILRPEFYRAAPFDRAAAMRELGLDPARPTGFVMFGGHGSRAMRLVAARLRDRQLVLVCGHNAALAARLRAAPAPAPRVVVGFTPRISELMRVADYFIGKPGPGSLSEALQVGLPVIVARNAWTMPQERYNTEWIEENGVGLVLDSFRSIRAAVDATITRLDAYRRRIATIRNVAVFEVPGILARLIADGAARGADPACGDYVAGRGAPAWADRRRDITLHRAPGTASCC